MDLTCKLPKPSDPPVPAGIFSSEPTQGVELTCKVPSSLPDGSHVMVCQAEPAGGIASKSQCLQSEQIEECAENHEMICHVLKTSDQSHHSTRAEPSSRKEQGIVRNAEKSYVTTKDSSGGQSEIAKPEQPSDGKMDATYKCPARQTAHALPIICPPSEQKKKAMSATFTVETKFDDNVATPIRPMLRKGFLEDADTMAFSAAAMLSSTRIMNSTAFSPGLVSMTYGEDDDVFNSPKTPVHPVKKTAMAATHSPCPNLPRSEAELKLDLLLKGLKADNPSNQSLLDLHAGNTTEAAAAEPITERVRGMFDSVQFTQVNQAFKPQPLEVRKRSHEDRAKDEVVSKKKKVQTEEQKRVVERVSAFQHLYAKHNQADKLDYYDRHQGAWTLAENHGSYASITFMQGSLSLNMVVGHRLQSEELRQGNKSTLVQHFIIQSLELRSKAAIGDADNVVRLAHHLLLMALTPSKLGEMCPTTRALEKTLRYLMMKVHEASMLIVDMDRIEHSHCYFRVTDDFKVSVKFYSIKCGFSFKTTLAYGEGFGTCRERGVDYERGPSNTSLMGKEVVQTLFKRTDVGWKQFPKFVDKVDAYIAQLEKDL